MFYSYRKFTKPIKKSTKITYLIILIVIVILLFFVYKSNSVNSKIVIEDINIKKLKQN